MKNFLNKLVKGKGTNDTLSQKEKEAVKVDKAQRERIYVPIIF